MVNGRFCEPHQQQADEAYERTRLSASKRGYGRVWAKLRKMVLARDPICRTRDCTKPSTDADHIIPKRRGGTSHTSNLQGLCHECHSRKTATEDGRWGD